MTIKKDLSITRNLNLFRHHRPTYITAELWKSSCILCKSFRLTFLGRHLENFWIIVSAKFLQWSNVAQETNS